MVTGCVGGGAAGGEAGPRLCEVPACEFPVSIATNPTDPRQPNGDEARPSYKMAMVMCGAGYDSVEQQKDWTDGVVLDLETGDVVWHHVRNKADNTVTSTECGDAQAAVVMTRLTPPQDWRFGRLLFAPCEGGDVVECGCVDGRASTRECLETYESGEAFNPNAWSDCDCG